MLTLPDCCYPGPDASPAERAYCAYNAAGDPATAGLNFRGDPCPTWHALPENVRAKWEGAVAAVIATTGPFPMDGLTFGAAIAALKSGYRVCRSGWNGKGMWLALSCDGGRETKAEHFWNPHNRAYAESNGGTATVLPCITMRTATGEILMGWLASQTDMLANDWQIVTG